jgi:glycosyltransferase involved in cell wall biosynthesis
MNEPARAAGGRVTTPVVHVITGLDVGGTEVMLCKLLRTIDRERFPSTVVSLGGRGTLADQIEALGVPVITLGMRSGRPSLRAVIRLVGVLRAHRTRVLQTWLYHADLTGWIAGRLARVPHIIWNVRCAELDPREHPKNVRWMLRLLARLSPRVTAAVVNSEAGRAESERLGYRPPRWVLIRNGFELDRFVPCWDARATVRTELGLPPDTPLVGLVARFHPMKDHRTFFEAATRVHRSRPDVHFILAGRGVDSSNADLVRMVETLDLRRVVHLVGERADIPRLTAALDLATCCSYSEGFPNTVGEAMSCAVPCVVTAVGDCATIVGDTGEIVPPRDPAAFAGACLALLDMTPEARRGLGERARRRVRDLFDIRAIALEYEALYGQLEVARHVRN